MKQIKDILTEFILKFAEEQALYSERARVVSVDTDKMTCTVETTDEKAEISGVQIAAFIGASFGAFIIPAVESIVTVSFYSKNEAYVSKTSVLDGVKLLFEDGLTIDANIDGVNLAIADGTTIEINDTQIIFNGGENNGLVISQNLSDRLNEIESAILQLQTDFTTWVPVPSDGGAALKTLISAGFGIKVIPNSLPGDFENDEILH